MVQSYSVYCCLRNIVGMAAASSGFLQDANALFV